MHAAESVFCEPARRQARDPRPWRFPGAGQNWRRAGRPCLGMLLATDCFRAHCPGPLTPRGEFREAERAELILGIRTDVPKAPNDTGHEHVRTLCQAGDSAVNKAIGTAHFDTSSQSPQYALAPESLSLPPITGQEANSRQDSCPFNSAFESFLFSRTTLCVFASPAFCPGSATHP
jgi:hypothetical protein